MFKSWKKKRIKKEYDTAITALQLSLYAVIVTILEEDVGEKFDLENIKNAAAITVNKLGLREDNRPDPLSKNDELSKAIKEIIDLTLIKEATALILLFSYFFSEKTEENYLVKAKELGCSDFDTVYNMIDIDKTTAAKVRHIGTEMSNTLARIVEKDLEKNF